MMKLYPTAEALRQWAGVYRGHGKAEEADLLMKAADLIEKAAHDPEMALHLAAFAAIAEDKGQEALAELLSHASEMVRAN